MRVQLTGGQVLDDHSSSSVEDDVCTVVEVMQVVATVEASVAEDMLQHQLLKANIAEKIHTVAQCEVVHQRTGGTY